MVSAARRLGGVSEEGVSDILNSFVRCGKMREIKARGQEESK